ncbi:hypothetical protein FD755_008113, partial [Muntiacus reevesi]
MDLVALLKSHFLCHLIFCYVFIASGLIINTIQLFTLLLWPVNKQLFRKINCRLSYCVSSHLHDPDNHDGVITHLEPDILECEVKWALGSIAVNKASGGDGIPVELF